MIMTGSDDRTKGEDSISHKSNSPKTYQKEKISSKKSKKAIIILKSIQAGLGWSNVSRLKFKMYKGNRHVYVHVLHALSIVICN